MAPPTDDAERLGPWVPLTVAAVQALFASGRLSSGHLSPAPIIWWLAGGHALDLYVGHPTRDHHDIDVAIVRVDAPLLPSILVGWDLHLAHQGVLTPWTTPTIDPPCHDIWCRAGSDQPWCLQVMLEDGTADEWVCRRHPAIRFPLSEAICRSPDGVPYLAPQLQLFMKAQDTRPKDDADFTAVFPLLSPAAASWLTDALVQDYPDHPWLRRAER